MESSNSVARQKSSRGSAPVWRSVRVVLLFLVILWLALACTPLYAQGKSDVRRAAKLPSPERIVGDYLKAVGGKKRLAAIRDATYSWTVMLKEQELGEARTQLKAPNAVRRDMIFGNGEINAAANASSAWERGLDGQLRTLVGTEASTARLRAMLEASRLVDYKKQSVLARTVALDETTGEPAYLVEFSMRNGARLRYWFSAATKLLLKISDDARKTSVRLMDYRVEAGVLEPHRMDLDVSGSGALTFRLTGARYNTGISEKVFDPPQSAGALNVPALLREVLRNQDAIDERVSEYTFTQKITERQIDERGETKKETVRVYEVYPLPNRAPVFRLISEQGVLLSPERAAKEEKRVTEELVKAEQNREKDKLKREQEKQKRQRERAERARKKGGDGSATAAEEGEDEELGISQFLRACEFVSPRTERFRERDAVVFDFRPRADFRPANREEEIISKLVGVVWIDPVDKQVMRLEARLSEGFKMGAGLLLKLSPGAAFVIEQTRMSDGVWLPRFAQINLSVRVLLFGGGSVNNTYEWSDYKRFNAETSGYKIGPPATDNPAEGKPNQ
ncbi:MAG TPA: hypothetical protein VIW80_06060 [Pyrinomonadaceae bacterium]